MVGYVVLVAHFFTVFAKGGGPANLWIVVLSLDAVALIAFVVLLVFCPSGVTTRTLVASFRGFLMATAIFGCVWAVLGIALLLS